ncbi:MAG: OmpA family protein [Sulfurovaceae bacterium]|nr:OmpA family protein [Sulfurovaceae bacterium]
MKKTIFLVPAILLFLFTGCSQNAPELNTDIPNNNISDVPSMGGGAGSGVNISENGEGANADALKAKMSPSGGLPNDGTYNNSSDGFQSVYFGFGDFTIVNDMQKAIDKNIQRLKSYNGNIKIEGNCDEFGTDEFNYALGLKRAKAVKDALVAQGVSADRFTIISLGESTPVCTEATDECYAQNRRVDLRQQ